MKKKISFKDLVLSEARQRKSGESSYGYLKLPKGINIFKEEPGSRVKLDFLPYEVTDPHHPDKDEELGRAVKESLWYKRPFKVHRNIGENNLVVVCPTTFKKPCPICEYRAKMIKEGKKYNDEEVKLLNVSQRNLYVVVPIESKDYEEKPYIWDISQFLFQNKLADEILENEEYAGFFDPEDGFTLRIRFSEEVIGKNKFADTSRIDFEERERKYDDKILSQVPHLDEILAVKSYEELKELFFGIADEIEDSKVRIDEDEDEIEFEPKKVARLNRGEVKQDKEDKFIEEEDDEDDFEVKVEETPKAKKEPIKKQAKENKCPNGYEFGVDTDKYRECGACEVWDECIDEKESL